MTKGQYLDKLNECLSGLPIDKVQEIIAEIYTHFEDGQAAGIDELEIADGLGSPAEVAKEYLRAYSDEGNQQQEQQTDRQESSDKRPFDRNYDSYSAGENYWSTYIEDWEFPYANEKIETELNAVNLIMLPHDRADVKAHFEGKRKGSPYIRFENNDGRLCASEIHPSNESGLLSLLLGGLSRLKGTLTIHVPRTVYSLNSQTHSGSQSLQSISAESAVSTASSGSIEWINMQSEGQATIQTNSGSQHIRDIKSGNAEFTASSGSISIENTAGQALRVKTNSGSIKLTDANHQGDVSLHNTSGSMNVTGLKGQSLLIRQNSGSLNADNLTVKDSVKISGTSGYSRLKGLKAASADIKQSSGSITIENCICVGTCTVESSSGSIKCDDIIAEALKFNVSSGSFKGRDIAVDSLYAYSSSGSMHIDMIKPANIEGNASSGSIKVSMPENSGFEYELNTYSGGMSINLPGSTDSIIGKKSARGTVGDGSRRVKLHTTSGRIRMSLGG